MIKITDYETRFWVIFLSLLYFFLNLNILTNLEKEFFCGCETLCLTSTESNTLYQNYNHKYFNERRKYCYKIMLQWLWCEWWQCSNSQLETGALPGNKMDSRQVLITVISVLSEIACRRCKITYSAWLPCNVEALCVNISHPMTQR
jgi:hypothetical protein